jgi:hypothetical protein
MPLAIPTKCHARQLSRASNLVGSPAPAIWVSTERCFLGEAARQNENGGAAAAVLTLDETWSLDGALLAATQCGRSNQTGAEQRKCQRFRN